MRSIGRKIVVVIVLLAGAASLGWAIYNRLQEQNNSGPKRRRASRVAPVEVAPIEHGPMQWRRTFSGALESPAAFVVRPKINGRVVRLDAALADSVTRGQVVAWLDDAEHVQLAAQAQAELAVAQASLAEARSALTIAKRELQRVAALRQRGVASESQVDAAQAAELTQEAQAKVAAAQVTKAEAALASAKVRLGYTQVQANWRGGQERRVVAERFVDEGDTVAANAPLLSIVELSPITGVIFVSERDYGRLRTGLAASLDTDAYPGERFPGRIDRIAPIFRQQTRQARVEVAFDNPEHRLKPGMFIRVTVVLDEIANATIVPEQALTRRDDRTGVFVVSEDGQSVAWREVRVGIRDGHRVQVEGEGLTGRVVTLGQQLVKDGAAITIPE